MSGFVLHPAALTDLNEIWEFIAADNPGAADRVLGEIYEAIRALIPFPQVGHSRSDLTSRPLRFHPLRDFQRERPAPVRDQIVPSPQPPTGLSFPFIRAITMVTHGSPSPAMA